MEKKRVSAYLVSSKDIDYNVMSQNFEYNVMSRWQGERKGEIESDQERVLKSMVAQSGKMSFYLFSILILFSCSMMFVRCGEI